MEDHQVATIKKGHAKATRTVPEIRSTKEDSVLSMSGTSPQFREPRHSASTATSGSHPKRAPAEHNHARTAKEVVSHGLGFDDAPGGRRRNGSFFPLGSRVFDKSRSIHRLGQVGDAWRCLIGWERIRGISSDVDSIIGWKD